MLKRVNKWHIYTAALFVALASFVTGCKQTPLPKPRGYFRVTLPERAYQTLKSDCPFTFEYPTYAIAEPDTVHSDGFCWYNIRLSGLYGTFHLSYKRFAAISQLEQFTEDTRKLAYKHSIKAQSIDEKVYEDNEHKIYGVLYQITGSAASPLQLYMTDSTGHFIRGALYFDARPNEDSIRPILEFVRQDILHIVETLRWIN